MAQEFVPFAKRKAAPLLPKNAEVRELETRNLTAGTAPSYQQIRSKFEPDLLTKNSRFLLSELVANQLSVEAEDQQRFDKRVVEMVEQRVAQLREEAYRDGHAEGLTVGKTEAFETQKVKLAAQLEALAMTVDTMAKAKELLSAQYEKALVEMAFRLAKTIIHYEVVSRPEGIWHTVETILTKIGKEDDVRVKLSPFQYEAIEGIKDQIPGLSRAGRISFEVDQRLPLGACIVESLSGEIASYVDQNFARLKEEIDKGMRETSDPMAAVGT